MRAIPTTPPMRPARLLAVASAVGLLALPAGADTQRLRSVSEWNQLCASYGAGSAKKTAYCKSKINRAVANGRALEPFNLVYPDDPSLLQSRSGVLFRHSINKELVEIREDTGLRMSVRLNGGVNCQAYAAALATGGLPRNEHSLDWLFASWLQVYTDARSEIRARRLREQEGRRVLEFVAETDDRREIRGAYAADPGTNAAIFSICDRPKASPDAQQVTELFFNSIAGTVRRYL